MARRWVIAGGGTGGHVTPALALGEAIRARGDEVLFVGSARGLESRLVPEAGFTLEVLPSEQVMGRSLLGRVRGALSILRSVGTALRLLRRFEADAVISVGGYAAMPVALATRLVRMPLFLVEPNAIPGRVNRLCAHFAKTVFSGFEATRSQLPARAESVCLGVPLRHALVRTFADRSEKKPPGLPLKVFVFGGSQGAHQLNENVPEALARLRPKSVEVFHQTGEADRAAVEARYAELGVPAEVVAFERDMPRRYAWADVAICRAGALTVSELALAGLPALLVPYPFAADDHQAANARALEEVGAAKRLDARPLDVNALAQAVAELVTTPGRLILMHEAAARLARPHAAAEIVEVCAARLEGRPPRAIADATKPPSSHDAGAEEIEPPLPMTREVSPWHAS
jgi:UDP-N-acetylglucosamine--N-acetylmuramyl-(pentapeptide) pyrophosphoryl-undecaprenol N-acetylglucosamine transferase